MAPKMQSAGSHSKCLLLLHIEQHAPTNTLLQDLFPLPNSRLAATQPRKPARHMLALKFRQKSVGTSYFNSSFRKTRQQIINLQ